MRVLFISANREDVIMRTLPLGLACVAAATKAHGHSVKVVDLISAREPLALLEKSFKEFRPEIIGLSIRNIDDQNLAKPVFFLTQIKKVVSHLRHLSDAPVVLGGAGYSIFPQSALEYLEADMGIQGEGETVFPELLQRIRKDRSVPDLPGLFVKGCGLPSNRHFVKKLDRMPLPDAALLHVAESEKQSFCFPVQTRRGCPMNCSYCSTAVIEGRTIRKHSIETVVRDMLKWFKAGVESFHFVDNIFNFPPSYAENLCEKLMKKRLPIKWRCIIYPLKISASLVRVMAKAGCAEVALGFESGSMKILQKMNKRFNLDDIQRASRMFSDAGIKQMGFLLLGGPGENRETVAESLTFADSLPLDMLKITAGIRIYPHTPLARTAVKEGRVSPEDTLLFPKFYLANGLEGWLPETLRCWCEKRPHWVI